MHDESLWLEIAWLCLLISLMAIGGANAMVPEIHRYVIEQRGWMRGDEFAALFAIAQASPGPNVLFITLIGWKVAGWPGAVASTVAMCGPSSTLALAAGRTMARNPQSRWRRVIKSGLAPAQLGGGLLAALDEAAQVTLLRPIPGRAGQVNVGTPEKVADTAPDR